MGSVERKTFDVESVRIVESVIFMESDFVSVEKLARISGLSKEDVMSALDMLKKEYEKDFHGLELVEIAGGVTLYPKKELWKFLENHYGKKNSDKLSRAALETLSIVAYSQPVTRAEIENIRGVSSDGMIKLLTERGLIKVVGKKEAPGRPLQYGTTKEFLKLFKLKSIADLPKLEEPYSEKFK